jgi:hypothetical protein
MREQREVCAEQGPANPNHGRGVRPHPLAVAPASLALTSYDRASVHSFQAVPARAVLVPARALASAWRRRQVRGLEWRVPLLFPVVVIIYAQSR